LDLGKSIQEIRKLAEDKKCTFSKIQLYCDTLLLDKVCSLDMGDDHPFILKVYARKVAYAPNASSSTFTMNLLDGSSVYLYIPNLPHGLPVQVVKPKAAAAPQNSALSIAGKYGVCIEYKGTVKQEPLEPPKGQAVFKHLDYMASISEDGRLRDKRLLDE